MQGTSQRMGEGQLGFGVQVSGPNDEQVVHQSMNVGLSVKFLFTY